MLTRDGRVTAIVSAVATAASTALPPSDRTCRPIRAACGSSAATARLPTPGPRFPPTTPDASIRAATARLAVTPPRRHNFPPRWATAQPDRNLDLHKVCPALPCLCHMLVLWVEPPRAHNRP